MSVEKVVRELRRMRNPDSIEGMKRYGIATERALGISVPQLRAVAKRLGKSHSLALGLWRSEIHDARLLAAMVDEPSEVTEGQMETWVSDFDSWDVCDCCCGILFDKTSFAYSKAVEWSKRKEEFVKRAGFVLMAELAVHDKRASDGKFLPFRGLIQEGSTDPRNFVKKAVNWALRQIGKRNKKLNAEALRLAAKISKMDYPSSRWVASDAIRELKSEAVQRRLRSSS